MRQQVSTGHEVPLNLALQGGGAHGAFTWGVLDRLLDEKSFRINAISGTSAGAMNGAALLSGLAEGGRTGAQRALESFWRDVSSRGRLGRYNTATAQAVLGGLGIDIAMMRPLLETGMQMFSPYEFNPVGLNPLRNVIRNSIDISAVARSPIAFFVTATHVTTGEARIFSNDEMSSEVLLASACLPTLFHAIEIDGEFYWDGGYSGNPSLMPLVHTPGASDLLLVQTSPTQRSTLPQNAREIAMREKEISFNTPLINELRLIAELQHHARSRTLPRRSGVMPRLSVLGASGRQGDPAAPADPIADLRLHRIISEEMNARSGHTKMNSAWQFLTDLREEGRQAADNFLKDHGADLGQRSTLDLSNWLQCAGHTGVRTARAS
ncbi:patatin-like phospholipase family protein [Labrenzia sp. 011]|uniref:patatin-like phospholipase family protein n=1 Tax=Labrenzia sp. 011 TaxID=2171494 RepID=UPI000D524DD5|nr:patatin-like phospholipase family protein [Labrenzia sp. 011]PVB59880.1 alpha/beta hydrolase [Labrenzia sp. 011]